MRYEKPIGKEIKKEETNATNQPNQYTKDDKEEEEEEEFPEDIDTSLDEEEDNGKTKEQKKDKAKGKDNEKTKPKTHHDNDKEEEDDGDKDYDNEEEKKPVKPKKKQQKPKKKKKKVKKKTITISYCKTTYQKYFDQFKLEMMGNYTDYEFVGVEHPVAPMKKFFSQFTFFSQIGVSILIMSGSKAQRFLPFIPNEVFKQIESQKWVILIGNYFLHSYLKTYLASSYAFELSIDGVNLWSKLATNTLPKVADMGRILSDKGY